MKTVQESVDVLIAGGGTAGHVAALQAARTGIFRAASLICFMRFPITVCKYVHLFYL
jgi:succinate dehydrogenase/fumarate reductase flavoprotein subunit